MHVPVLESSDAREQGRLPRYLRAFVNYLASLDYFQIVIMFALMTFGLCFIYGSGHQYGGENVSGAWEKQLLWLCGGLVAYIIFSLIPYRFLGKISPVIYCFALLLLGYVLLFSRPIFGARRWIDMGFFSYQPSELGKLAFLLFGAYLIAAGFSPRKLISWFVLGLTAALPALLILKEPDLGSTMTLLFIWAILFFVSGLRWRWIILFLALFAVGAPIGYAVMPAYQKARIETFLNPESDIRGQGWTAHQSRLAVGSGGLHGKGYMKGTLHTLDYIPRTVSNSDFIFSVIAEETGFLGSLLLIGLYALLIGDALYIAFRAPDLLGQLIACGAAGVFFIHVFVNIGMHLRLCPITGIPLPLVSYGGTFAVSSLIYLGILQSIFRSRTTPSA